MAIKPFKLPKGVGTAPKPKTHVIPKPDDITPTIPRFSIDGLFINGIPVGSTLEWNIACALDVLQIGYRYQVPLLGGYVRGGSIADFEVYTKPVSVYVYAQGDYWHSRDNKEEEDQFQFARIEAAYHKQVVEVWEHEALTVQQATTTLKVKLRSG